MARATDLQLLGNRLEALIASEPTDNSGLSQWYLEAHQLREEIIAKPDLSNAVPHAVWHYLSDADIRLKDVRYALLQRKEIDEIVAILKRGQRP